MRKLLRIMDDVVGYQWLDTSKITGMFEWISKEDRSLCVEVYLPYGTMVFKYQTHTGRQSCVDAILQHRDGKLKEISG